MIKKISEQIRFSRKYSQVAHRSNAVHHEQQVIHLIAFAVVDVKLVDASLDHARLADRRHGRSPAVSRRLLLKVNDYVGVVEDDLLSVGQLDASMPVADRQCLEIFVLQEISDALLVGNEARVDLVEPGAAAHLVGVARPVHRGSCSRRDVDIEPSSVGRNNLPPCVMRLERFFKCLSTIIAR